MVIIILDPHEADTSDDSESIVSESLFYPAASSDDHDTVSVFEDESDQV